MSKYVKIDDVMALINTSNRGNCDYFIVDKIEELCNSNDVYDIEKGCYNKAIDEFAERLHELCGMEIGDCQYQDVLHESRIDEIAKQLKSKTDF